MNKLSAPKVFFYNPTCEIAISNGTVSYMPNKTLSGFEKDLDVLPMYFSQGEDVMLVQQMPDERFKNLLTQAGISLPKFQLLNELLLQDKKGLKLDLHPWGWSPRIHHILKPLKEHCCDRFLKQSNAWWKAEHKDIYSRKKALEVLDVFLDSHNYRYLSKSKKARICTSVEEIEQLILEWQQIVIKAPWSSSGRGLQVLRQSHLNDSITQWINGTLQQQKYLMVEALLDKQFDFSLQYRILSSGKIEFLGPGFFETNSNGQYVGNILGGMPDLLKEHLNNELIEELADGVANAMIKAELNRQYCGYLGVDCMIYKDEEGQIKVHPCVEINLRYNMGTLAIFLDRYLHKESKGYFKVHFQPKSTFDLFHQKMEKEHPFVMKNGKWYSGYLPLVSPFQGKKFGVYLVLENQNTLRNSQYSVSGSIQE
jgi:hypothetical protein